MGTPKMLLSYGENTIIETVIDRICQSRVEKIMLVAGSGKEAVMAKMAGRPVEICINPAYTQGMFSSVRCGFMAIPREAEAVMVFLGDQPMVRPPVIDDIVEAWEKSGKGMVIPVFQGKRGHPVLIDAKYRDEITGLDPERGLRSLVENHPEDILEIETPDSSVLRDIDTASDYQREMMQEQ